MFEEIEVTPSLKLKERLEKKQLEGVCRIVRDRISQLISEKPIASIVVSAYNEEMYMLSMLLAMSKLQTQYPIEFIGVDNASSDKTGEIFEKCGFRTIYESKKGLSYARQRGLIEAKGEYIFSTDADVLVPPTWIDASLQYFEENERLMCFSGGVNSETPGSSVVYSLLRGLARRLNSKRTTNKVDYFTGQNLVYRRDVAMKFGGYEPGINLGEDGLIEKKCGNYGDTLSTSRDPKTKVTSSGRRTANILLVMKLILERKSRIFGIGQRATDFTDVR